MFEFFLLCLLCLALSTQPSRHEHRTSSARIGFLFFFLNIYTTLPFHFLLLSRLCQTNFGERITLEPFIFVRSLVLVVVIVVKARINGSRDTASESTKGLVFYFWKHRKCQNQQLMLSRLGLFFFIEMALACWTSSNDLSWTSEWRLLNLWRKAVVIGNGFGQILVKVFSTLPSKVSVRYGAIRLQYC